MTIIRRSRTVEVSHPVQRPERLPWPRVSEGETPVLLGVDVVAKKQDVIKIVHKWFRVEGVTMEELLQEVFLAIVHKNHTRSAHDPRKSSFGHYVYLVANNVCINLVHKQRRYSREQETLDAPYREEDTKPLIETKAADTEEVTHFDEKMDETESILRRRGYWELARYVRVARSGVSIDVMKEVLSYPGKPPMSNKNLRDLRNQIRNIVQPSFIASISNLKSRSPNSQPSL